MALASAQYLFIDEIYIEKSKALDEFEQERIVPSLTGSLPASPDVSVVSFVS